MEFVSNDASLKQRVERVYELIDGFEDSYGLELLSTVHWVMHHESQAMDSEEAAIAAVHNWNARKRPPSRTITCAKPGIVSRNLAGIKSPAVRLLKLNRYTPPALSY